MARHQDTELVDDSPRAPPRTPGVLQRPLPRGVWIPLVLLLVGSALLLAVNMPVLHVYEKHFSEKLPAVKMPWNALTAGMDEASVRAQLAGVTLRCVADASGVGERVCYAAVSEVDGYSALTLALFLRGGRLALATVHVPWWAHGKAADVLHATLGASQRASAGTFMPLRRWNVAGGYVDMNQRRSLLNPLAWSAIVWTPRPSESAPARP